MLSFYLNLRIIGEKQRTKDLLVNVLGESQSNSANWFYRSEALGAWWWLQSCTFILNSLTGSSAMAGGGQKEGSLSFSSQGLVEAPWDICMWMVLEPLLATNTLPPRLPLFLSLSLIPSPLFTLLLTSGRAREREGKRKYRSITVDKQHKQELGVLHLVFAAGPSPPTRASHNRLLWMREGRIFFVSLIPRWYQWDMLSLLG